MRFAMRFWNRTAVTRPGTWLGRLRRDTRGNTLAIMAAALIPLAGMVGGGLDVSRMYITKTRLQHACDAGALAGRRQMGGGSWGTDDSTAATKFFDANFVSGSYGTDTLTRAYTENAGKVTGNASARVPMTLMKVLGFSTETLTVKCDAEMRLPNTDVMFVLDTTGSMNCVAGDTSCSNNGGVAAKGSKLDGLKEAVKCFFQIVAQLDIDDQKCDAGEPTGGTGSQVQIRFGFMPYSSNVNVGKLLPTSFFANSWNYQSRLRKGNSSGWSDWKYSNTTYPNGDPTNPDGNGNCATTNTATHERRNAQKLNGKCYWEFRDYGPLWTYASQPVDVSKLKNGTSWRDSFSWPINNDGSDRTVTWDGCIEERPTVRATSYDPIPATAYDLNVDLVPSQGTAASLWGPALDQVIFLRNILTDDKEATTATSDSANNYYNPSAACPTQAVKLQEWPTAAPFKTYVNSLVGAGNTYHDIGMLWGARFMSPDGIFKSENSKSADGGTIQRHVIFMTDGDSTSTPCDYNAYGVPWFDQRQTTDVGAAADCTANRQKLIDQIDRRLETLCKVVKTKGTLWVISYGGDVNAANEARLKTCASDADATIDTHYFKAVKTDELKKAFAAIANNISQLRLTE